MAPSTAAIIHNGNLLAGRDSNAIWAKHISSVRRSVVVSAKIRSPNEQKQEQQQQKPDKMRLRPYTGGVASAACDALERLIERHVDPAQLPARCDPAVQLAGNFAPVEERPPTDCSRVSGDIPPCMHGGVYVRNGPNPLHPPAGGYHYFDGHGMLHAVLLGARAGDIPTYACRYTRTSRFLQESRAGKPLFPNPLGGTCGAGGAARMGLMAVRAVLGVVDLSRGDGPANAGLAYHNGRLLAMAENDMPYAVRVTGDGDLLTLGRCSFNGSLRGPMTAHPKVDPRTGDLYAYGYNVLSPPYVRYFRVTASGKMGRDVAVEGITKPVLLHDFAVTENYAVIPENQISFRLGDLLRGGSAVVCDETRVPRFGVRPKSEGDSMVKWFDVPGFTAFHFVNAWEEGDTIVMVGSKAEPLAAIFDDPESLQNTLHEVRLNLATGSVSQSRVSPVLLDVGQLNHRFTGTRSRYAYMCIYGPWPRFAGVAKVDLQSVRRGADCSPTFDDDDIDRDPAVVAWRKFGDGVYGSEPFFVPAADGFDPQDEDNGYLVCYVHNEITNVSEMLIMDARSPKLETIASIEMPSRVPYGFHGLFITKEQLAKQNMTPVL